MTDEAIYIITIVLAILSMLTNKSKYSTFFSIGAILALFLVPLEKTTLESSVLFLIVFTAFESICFTQKAWDFHRFKKTKSSRHKLFWITVCLTIGLTAAFMSSMNFNNYTLKQITFDQDLLKILIPIAFCVFGLIKNKKRNSV